MNPIDQKACYDDMVSVIIPVYNSEDYISATLESVLAQTYSTFEIILVDDGSSDGTVKIITEHQEKENNGHGRQIKYFYQENSGPSVARNKGINEANGEFLIFLDADDLWPLDTLKNLTDYLYKNPDVYLVFGDAGSFSSEGRLFASAFKKFGTPDANERGILKNAFYQLLERNFILTGTALFKKEVFEKTYPFDPQFRYGEDYDLWTRISLFYKIGRIDDIVMYRRQHSRNVSRNNEVSFYLSRAFSLLKLKREYNDTLLQKNIWIYRYVLIIVRRILYFYYNKKNFNGILYNIKLFFFYSLNYFQKRENSSGFSKLIGKIKKYFW